MTMGPDDWEQQEPSGDFVERVMDRAFEEAPAPVTPTARRRPSLRAGIAGGLALAAAIALAVGWRGQRAADHGDVVASQRTEVHIGARGRAIAVLEPGAHVSWRGDEVEQPAGDVFYRVEPGGAFDVHTGAGDVQVLGTCFRVRVEGVDGNDSSGSREDRMNGRDVRAGVLGAALTAAAFVSVYEGKIALSHASERVTLTAGQSARADRSGVTRDGDDGVGQAASADPLMAANANLANAVRDYQRRLDAIEGQKATIAKQLSEAQRKLALTKSDAPEGPSKSRYDNSEEDWKALAKEGTVVARTPCSEPATWTPSPADLEKRGLAPGDAEPIHDALQQSSQRVWSVIRPLCAQALQGSLQVAEGLGPHGCVSLIEGAARMNKEDTQEEVRAVAEMRAGELPYDPKALGTYGQVLYAESGEVKAIEQQLAQSIGPADAKAYVYGDGGCWSNSSWGVGPRTASSAAPAPSAGP